jgi:hypothetical protein
VEKVLYIAVKDGNRQDQRADGGDPAWNNQKSLCPTRNRIHDAEYQE